MGAHCQLRGVLGRGRPHPGAGGSGARPRTRAAAARRQAPRPAEEGESHSALPDATSPGVLWHRTRRESARELPRRRGLFLTCPPFHSCLSGLRARPLHQPRPRAPHLARQLRTLSTSPDLRPSPLRWHRAVKSQPGKDRLGAACLSAKYWNRVGWGRGSPALSSPRFPPRSQSGCERRLQLSLRKQGATGPGRRAPFWFSAFSLERHPSSVTDEAGALSHGPSAYPTSSLLPKLLQTNSI